MGYISTLIRSFQICYGRQFDFCHIYWLIMITLSLIITIIILNKLFPYNIGNNICSKEKKCKDILNNTKNEVNTKDIQQQNSTYDNTQNSIVDYHQFIKNQNSVYYQDGYDYQKFYKDHGIDR